MQSKFVGIKCYQEWNQDKLWNCVKKSPGEFCLSVRIRQVYWKDWSLEAMLKAFAQNEFVSQKCFEHCFDICDLLLFCCERTLSSEYADVFVVNQYICTVLYSVHTAQPLPWYLHAYDMMLNKYWSNIAPEPYNLRPNN